jgi:hypothetical protein
VPLNGIKNKKNTRFQFLHLHYIIFLAFTRN